MKSYLTGIAGFGHLGQLLSKTFKDSIIYDKCKNIGSIDELNTCDCVFICVPTPMGENGKCDTSAVEEVISQLKVDLIIIRSTVYVGFTDEMVEKYKKNIVFQPEYYGETVAHPFENSSISQWLSFGGTDENINKAINVYKQVCNSNVKIYQDTAKNVEFAKYVANSFYALKVTFFNEIYDIAEVLGVNYNRSREIFLADNRIGNYHTFIYEDNRGYGGSCLPKDIASLINQAETNGFQPEFLKSISTRNKFFLSKNSNNEKK